MNINGGKHVAYKIQGLRKYETNSLFAYLPKSISFNAYNFQTNHLNGHTAVLKNNGTKTGVENQFRDTSSNL